MKHYSLVKGNQRGMTLIELIVALLILGIAVTAFLPLQVIVAKNIKSVQQKQQAAQLASKIMEDLVFNTTAANYNTSTDLTIGRSQWVDADSGFTVEKVISWVDDPADGTFGDPVSPDPIPYDYKSVKITVSATNPFSGKLQAKAVLNSNLAREGAGDPFSGVIVKVNRAFYGSEPIAGAYVTVWRNADVYTGVSDDKGQVILPIELPAGSSDDLEYNVDVAKDGWMKHPSPLHSNKVMLNRWATRSIQMQMEIPQKIALKFKAGHQDGTATLSGIGITTTTVNIDPTNETNPIDDVVTFSPDLWPGFTYQVDVKLTAWQENFDSNNGSFSRWKDFDPGPPARDNPWKWQAGSWTAKPPNLSGSISYNDGYNRLAKTIDLSSMKKAELDWDPSAAAQLSWHYHLSKGTASLQLMYVSDAGALISDSSGWTSVSELSGTAADGETNSIHNLDSTFMTNASSSTNKFTIRFDASGTLNELTIDDLKLVCRYSGGVSFNAAQIETNNTKIVSVTN